MKSAKEIKDLFQAACVDELPELIKEYENDERAGVKKLLESAEKKIIAYEKEVQRIEQLKQYEKQYADYHYICGPEVMMRPLYGSLESNMIEGEYSMERYMKCAIGVCGQCCVDNTGWRICAEGPVFSSDQVSEIVEFGKFHRTASGMKEYF